MAATKNDPFVLECQQLLSKFGAIQARAMFGAISLSVDGLTFAIVDDGELWLKADEKTKATFEAAGCQRFTFPGGTMNYYSAPAEVFDSEEALQLWVGLALSVAKPSKR